MTMTLVSTVTVGAGGASSITFSSIPQDGTDLVLLISGKSSAASDNVGLRSRFNSATTNYAGIYMESNTTGTTNNGSYSSLTYIGDSYVIPGQSVSSFSSVSLHIPNYSDTSNKTISIDGVNGSVTRLGLYVFRWNGGAAITSVSMFLDSGNWVQNSTASLYKITKGSGGATVS